jgi:hypothetical protein
MLFGGIQRGRCQIRLRGGGCSWLQNLIIRSNAQSSLPFWKMLFMYQRQQSEPAGQLPRFSSTNAHHNDSNRFPNFRKIKGCTDRSSNNSSKRRNEYARTVHPKHGGKSFGVPTAGRVPHHHTLRQLPIPAQLSLPTSFASNNPSKWPCYKPTMFRSNFRSFIDM